MIDPTSCDWCGDNTTRAQRKSGKLPLVVLLAVLGAGFGAIFFFGLGG